MTDRPDVVFRRVLGRPWLLLLLLNFIVSLISRKGLLSAKVWWNRLAPLLAVEFLSGEDSLIPLGVCLIVGITRPEQLSPLHRWTVETSALFIARYQPSQAGWLSPAICGVHASK